MFPRRVEMVPERSEVMMSLYDVVVNDGEWHHLNLLITREEMRLRLDNTTSVQPLQQHMRTGRSGLNNITILQYFPAGQKFYGKLKLPPITRLVRPETTQYTRIFGREANTGTDTGSE